MANRIQFRRDTKARWAEINPILLEGEIGLETDTQNIKMGDGVNAWNSLEYGRGYSNVTNDPGTSENLAMTQKGVTELIEGTKDGITATKFPTVKIEDFAVGVTETGSAKSKKILEKFRTWLDSVDFSNQGKYIGHCRVSLDGRNADVYNYVFSYETKYGVQVVKGGFWISNKEIATAETFNVFYRIFNDGSIGEWISISSTTTDKIYDINQKDYQDKINDAIINGQEKYSYLDNISLVDLSDLAINENYFITPSDSLVSFNGRNVSDYIDVSSYGGKRLVFWFANYFKDNGCTLCFYDASKKLLYTDRNYPNGVITLSGNNSCLNFVLLSDISYIRISFSSGKSIRLSVYDKDEKK